MLQMQLMTSSIYMYEVQGIKKKFQYDMTAYTNPFQVLTFLWIKMSQNEIQKQRQVAADVL